MGLILERSPSRKGREGAPWALGLGQPGLGFWGADLAPPHPAVAALLLLLGCRPRCLGGRARVHPPLYKGGPGEEEENTQVP
jgi:hypothetical protein